MKPRTSPVVVRNGWPRFTVDVHRDMPIVFRAFGVSSQAWELSAWFGAMQAHGLDGVPPAVFQIADAAERGVALAAWLAEACPTPEERAEWTASRILHAEGSIGWVLMDRWADPDLELETWAEWRAGKFTGEDAKITAGAAALREICDGLGIGTKRAESIAVAVLRRMQVEEPDAEDVAEARVFRGPTR